MAKRGTPWNPNTAGWLVTQRGSRTQDAVIADMAGRGVKVKRAWLSRIENGAPFSDELLAAFADYYGSVPPPFEPVDAAPANSDAVLAALTANTEAVNALVARLDTFVGPLGEVVADLMRERVRAATDRTRSGAPTS